MSEIVVTDLDGTLVAEDDSVIEETAASLRSDAEAGYEIYVVSGRNIDRLDETREWLAANEIPVDEIHLSDFPEGPNASREFKLYKAELILEGGDEIVVWWEDDFQTRQELIDLGVPAENPETLKSVRAQKDINDRVAPAGAQEEARRGLEWRAEYGRGGTAVGVARARDISNGVNLSVDTLRRMVSYFARHEIDQEGEGWSPGEDGYPSAGRIAWALWGGTPARTWAINLLEEIDAAENATSATPHRRSTESRRSSMQPSHKSVPASFQVKAASSDAPHGEATALVSVFNNVDLVGDRILPGAFADSLKAIKESGRSIPWVWSHQWSDPNAYIGKILEATETEKGLLVRASFFNTETAQHIKTLLAEGVVSEFSFAYDVIDQDTAEDGVNELKAINILEAGPTLKGCNPATQLVNVRSVVNSPALSTSHKVGRTLSSKNEQRIRDARSLLEEVLSTIDSSNDTVKTEEPTDSKESEAKVEERGLDGDVALMLLELEDSED